MQSGARAFDWALGEQAWFCCWLLLQVPPVLCVPFALSVKRKKEMTAGLQRAELQEAAGIALLFRRPVLTWAALPAPRGYGMSLCKTGVIGV